MKIVFVNGPYRRRLYSRSSRSPAVTKSGTIYYPLWLSYAAGWVVQDGRFEVDLIDAVTRRFDQATLAEHLRQQGGDLFVIETSTPSIDEDIHTAVAIKEALPGAKVVLAGTHATVLPEPILRGERRIDGVLRGEYDQTVVDLAAAIADRHDWDSVAGLSFLRDEQAVHTAERPLLQNLDDFPFVTDMYRRFLRPEDYFFAAARYPMVMIITSRGCPHRCQWCLYPQVMHRGKYRTRSAQNVAEEFAFIAKEMPSVREIGIEDDLFTGDRRRLRDICQRLIAQRNRIKFWCDTRVDLDAETMQLMKAAGCRLLIVGFESANQDILDTIRKGTRAEQAHEFMAHARRAGLLVHGCFVLGNPGETHDTMRETLTFAKKLNPDTGQFFPMMVYPGTQMYDWAKSNHYLRTEDYNAWLTPEGLHEGMVDQPQLSAAEVRRFCDYARREFYLRRSYVFRKLRQSLLNPWEAQRNVKAFCRLARHLVNT